MPPITETKTPGGLPVTPINGNNDKISEAEQIELDKLSKVTSNFNPVIPIYTMHYRRGNRPPEITAFQYDGNLQKAILRARNHCEKMGYRFCGAFSFLIDLDKVEKAHEDGTFQSERT